MKKYIVIALLMVLGMAYPAYAQWSIGAVGGRVAAAGSSCNPANDEVGDKNTEANDRSQTAAYTWCFLAAADCSGDLDTGYVYNLNTSSGNSRVCIYNDLGTAGTPDSSDTKVGCTGEISSVQGGTQFDSSAFTSGSVTATTNYWVCNINAESVSWETKSGESAGLYFKSTTGWYASPPANLGDSWSTIAWKPLSAYGTIK